MMTANDYQQRLFDDLRNQFLDVRYEWRAFRTGDKHKYAPRVDIAIGPFNDEDAPRNLMSHYDDIVHDDTRIRTFLKRAYTYHKDNLDDKIYSEISPPSFLEVIEKNRNARCLLAIEIENRNSRKHMMGSIVNAASLGRVGIGVGYTEAGLTTFLRIVNYLGFLKKVGKNGYDTCNFLILSVGQMNELVARNKR